MAIERNLGLLSKIFEAKVDGKAFERFLSLSEKNPQQFRGPDEDQRIFPNTFAPVIHSASINGKMTRVISPMRYRIRPQHSLEEVPSKFNLFNARLDSLEKRRTWSPLFGKNHGLFPFTSFYEWVERNQAKQLVRFGPRDYERMCAPVLFDYFQDDEMSFYSFAIITTDPPDEVQEAGHDRCPIFLKKEYWNDWLNPQGVSKEGLYSFLQDPKEAFYDVFDEPKEKGKIKKLSPQLDLFEQDQFGD